MLGIPLILGWFLGVGMTDVKLGDLQGQNGWHSGGGEETFPLHSLGSLFTLCHPWEQCVASGQCVSVCGVFFHSNTVLRNLR